MEAWRIVRRERIGGEEDFELQEGRSGVLEVRGLLGAEEGGGARTRGVGVGVGVKIGMGVEVGVGSFWWMVGRTLRRRRGEREECCEVESEGGGGAIRWRSQSETKSPFSRRSFPEARNNCRVDPKLDNESPHE